MNEWNASRNEMLHDRTNKLIHEKINERVNNEMSD